MAMNADYEAYRKTQIEDGQMFQDFVVDIAYQAGLVIAQYTSKAYQLSVGESRTGVEIKYDKRMKDTGNLCIEVSEKARPRPGPYVSSGIMRNDHWLYAIGDYNVVFFLATKLLRALHFGKRYRTYEIPTSQGFLLPVTDARKYAALLLEPDASGTVSARVAELEQLAKSLHEMAYRNPEQLSFFAGS